MSENPLQDLGPGLSSPPIDLDLVFEDGDWSAILCGGDGSHFVIETAGTVLDAVRTQSKDPWPGPFGLAVTLTGDDHMQQVNHSQRGQDKPTNVLSFPAWNEDDLARLAMGVLPSGHPPGLFLPLGDILMARETVAREAMEQGKSFPDHIRHLLVHAVLHLVGYDHMQDDEAEDMEKLEVEILKSLGISDPYQIREHSANRHD